MIILGIDPGYALTGWGVLEVKDNVSLVIDYGFIKTNNPNINQKIYDICNALEDIIKKYKPDESAIEEVFFSKNKKTAISVAQIRGAIIFVLMKKNIPVFGYTPLQVKQSVVGYGRATKNQVQNMVKILLNLNTIPKPDDVADALAIGVCHSHSRKFNKLIEKNI